MTKMAKTMAAALLAGFFSANKHPLEVSLPAPKRRAVERGVVEHFFIGKLAKDSTGRILPVDGAHVPDPCSLGGPPRKHIRKSRELITKWNVRVKEVPFTVSERIDRNKYTGAVLRDLRAQRGVGC